MLKITLIPLSLALCLSSVSAQKIEGAAPNQSGIAPVTGKSNISGPSAAAAVVPAAFRTAMSGRANSIPFSWTPTRFQSPYLASELPSSLVVKCLAYRGARTDTGATIDMEIFIGYTTFTHTNITSNYANNYNSGTPVLVYKRKMFKVPDMSNPRNTNPGFFVLQIPLDTPFIWTKQTGRNLLIEIRIHGNSNGNRSFSYFIEQSTTRVANGGTTTRIYSNSNVNATTGFITRGLAPIVHLTTKCKVSGDYTPYGKGCPGTGGFSGDVVPRAYATKFGETGLYYGFGRGNMRLQQVVNGKELPTPRSYTGLSLRQDDRVNGRTGGSVTFKMSIGNTTHDENSLTPSWSHNFDAGTPQVVFNGTLNIPTTTGTNKDVGKFISYVKFTRPWLWIPKKGESLLFETIQTSTTTFAVYMDQVSAAGSSVRTVYAFSATAVSATSQLANRGYVLGLETSGGGTSIPALGSAGRPVIGSTFNVTLALAKATAPVILVIGGSDSKWGAINLPFNFAGFGAPLCNLLASIDIMVPGISNAQGASSFPFPVPNDTNLVGANFYNQYVVVDSAANGMGLAFSNGGKGFIGEQ